MKPEICGVRRPDGLGRLGGPMINDVLRMRSDGRRDPNSAIDAFTASMAAVLLR
jgi:hypothetical protein